MAAAQGINFLLSIGANVLGGQRGAKLNRSMSTIDVTAKASTGQWKENLSSFKEWGIDADALVVEDDAAYLALETAFENGTALTVSLESEAGHTYSGSAYLTDFPLDAPYDDAATISVTLQGTGALAKTDAT